MLIEFRGHLAPAYASDSLYVHAAERVIADYIVHDGKNLRLREPKYGSEPAVPLTMSKRFILMCIFLDDACKLGFEAQLKADWKAIDAVLKS